jgi:hypothetical protein
MILLPEYECDEYNCFITANIYPLIYKDNSFIRQSIALDNWDRLKPIEIQKGG